MMNAVIIEDETVAVNNLKAIIANNKVADIKIVAELESVEESVVYFSHMKHPDVIFADIHLTDGIVFKIFERVKINVPVIFTTAYEEYAIKAFELYSIGYLLKPVSQDGIDIALNKLMMLKNGATENEVTQPEFLGSYFERLHRAIDSVHKDITKEKSEQPLFLKDGNKIVKVNQDEILYLEGYGDYVKIYHTSGKILLSQVSLKRFEGCLDEKRFCRVHRSFIIAIPYINYIERKRIKIGSELIPISDSHYPYFMGQLGLQE